MTTLEEQIKFMKEARDNAKANNGILNLAVFGYSTLQYDPSIFSDIYENLAILEDLRS